MKKRVTISVVLIFILFLLLTLITSIIGIYNYTYTREDYICNLKESLERAGTRLQLNLPSAFYDMDMPQIRNIIQSEMMDRDIFCVILRESEDQLFFSGIRNENWEFIETKIKEIPASKNYFSVKKEIILADLSVNSVTVVMTDVFLQKELKSLLQKTVIGVVSVDMVVLFILFLMLRLILVKPIIKLREYANAVESGSLDTQKPRGIFFGELADLHYALGQMVFSLKEFIEKLKRMDKIKDEFLANTSHELRTPLNGIIGITESLIEGVAGKPGKEMQTNLSLIVSSARRLSGLVNDILDFSKLKTHTLELKSKSVNLRVAADVVLKLSQPLIAKKKLKLNNEIKAEFPPVMADENRVQQILHNLIGNAIKFTRSGSVTISAHEQDNNMAAISISDTGIGIPKDKLEDIFMAFEQADGSTAREYGGTGLGLSVSKKLVEIHGGTTQVVSEPGKGSVFTFTLPISQETILPESRQEIEVSPENTDLEHADTDLFEKETVLEDENKIVISEDAHKILVIDDEMINQQVFKNALSQGNYHVTQALTGREALNFINNGIKFDLVLLDIMLPMMSGYEVCEKIREKYQANELPIIMVSAKDQVCDRVSGLKVGANDYLNKPVARKELLARITTHINLKELTSENMRMGAELGVARKLQKMFLPTNEEIAAIKELDIAGYMEPAEEVGGDYYDILQNNERLRIGIGDVSGHGLESGIIMLMAQTAIRTLNSAGENNAVRFMNYLNKTVYDNIQRMGGDKMMTLSILDYHKGILKVMGQHEDVLVVRKNGLIERINTSDLGMFIGMLDDISEFVSEANIVLKPGDGIVLYTDGIIEAHREGTRPLMENLYGIDRLCNIISQNWDKSAELIKQSIVEDVRQYVGEKSKMFDDLTLLILKQR